MITDPNNSSPMKRFSPEAYKRMAVIARNLQVARKAVGLLQQDLISAQVSSRTTISKIESGEGDPRLSTIVDLATKLGISPLLLLISKDELLALAEAVRSDTDNWVTLPDEVAVEFELMDISTPKRLEYAIKRAFEELKPDGNAEKVGTAIGTAHLPGEGSQIGKALGRAFRVR